MEKISWTDGVRNEEIFALSQGGEEYPACVYNEKKDG
jgi:hypothetical protein